MTRSYRSGSRDPSPPSKTKRPSREKKILNTNIILLVVLVLFITIAVGWSLGDVTGEYTSTGYSSEVVRLSLVRRAANVKCELSWGYGAILEATVSNINPNQELHIVFHVAPQWLHRGQQDREVILNGRFKNGAVSLGGFQDNEIDARLIEGTRIYKVRLVRNSISSLSRQIQAHLPTDLFTLGAIFAVLGLFLYWQFKILFTRPR